MIKDPLFCTAMALLGALAFSMTSCVMFLVFFIGRWYGTFEWSWWWVTCPLWAGLPFSFLWLLIWEFAISTPED